MMHISIILGLVQATPGRSKRRQLLQFVRIVSRTDQDGPRFGHRVADGCVTQGARVTLVPSVIWAQCAGSRWLASFKSLFYN